jgi:hypothetical protein
MQNLLFLKREKSINIWYKMNKLPPHKNVDQELRENNKNKKEETLYYRKKKKQIFKVIKLELMVV